MFPHITVLLFLGLSLPAHGVPMLTGYEARLTVERVGGAAPGTKVQLLSGFPETGAIAAGLASLNNAGSGPVETLWLVQNLRGVAPPDDIRMLTFSFDGAGDFSGISPDPFYDPDVAGGIDPQPFRIFLAAVPPSPIAPPDLLGELDFRDVSSVTLGSLENITGLRLITDAGTLTFAPFSIEDAPEPGTLALLALGLIGSACARGGRQRAPPAT